MELTQFHRSMLSGARGFTPLRLRPLDIKGHKCNYKVCPHDDSEQLVYPCAPGAVYDAVHGYRPLRRCNKWTCKYCRKARIKRWTSDVYWFRRFHNMDRETRTVFLTLTFHAECVQEGCTRHWRYCVGAGHARAVGARGKELKRSTRDAYFRRFISRLREFCNTDSINLEYLRVVEKTKAGVEHYHLLVSNMPHKYKERYLRNLCSRLWNDVTKNSYIVDVRNTYGHVENYIGKYLVKGIGREKGRRNYSYSKGALRPPRLRKVFEIERDKIESPQDDVTPFEQAFGVKRPVFVTESAPKDGARIFRQACNHDECEMRLWHSDKQYENFERSVGYMNAMRRWMVEQEEDKLWHR